MAVSKDFAARYGPWAVISGGAQGIGAAYADRLAGLGLSLVLLDIDAAALAQTAARLRTAWPTIEIIETAVDLADAVALEQALDGITHLEIGLLVANAGIGAIGRWLDVPLATKLNQIAVNCASPLILAHRLTSDMAERRRGGVIVMSSGSAEMGSTFITTYAATKAFDRVLAEGLWAELTEYGVDVTTVMPGAVDTPGFRASIPTGLAPTRVMQPANPFSVVDAALSGLGRQINVRPNLGVFASFVMSVLLTLLPRRLFLRLGDRAVRAMYARPPTEAR